MSIIRQAFSQDSLYEAWRRVRAKRSAPGVDGVTVFGFGRNIERNLSRISHDIISGVYRPDPLLRCHIPKADGDFRRIGIPTVRDRVAQRALLNVLLDKVDSRLHPSSYAYRPGRSVRMAVAEIERLRDMGGGWTARADIDLCFDTIPHQGLLAEIDQWIGEPAVTELIERWLRAGCIDGDQLEIPDKGVPQGDILSPVLSNIYLDSFDRRLSICGERFVRYADDILIACKDRPAACAALRRASEALAELELRLDPEKSAVLSFSGGFRYLGTLFVRSMALPAVRVERTDGSVYYASGYESSGPVSLDVGRDGETVVVRASGMLTEHQLWRRVARELYLAKRGHGTAVGQALVEAWRERQRERQDSAPRASRAGPADWAFVA